MESQCCKGNPEAIKWNPYNKVVQCHICGQVYEAVDYKARLKEATGKWFSMENQSRVAARFKGVELND